MARSENRTEKPTQRRRQDARKEGRNAKSKEVGVAVSLLAAALSLQVLGPGAAESVAVHSRSVFAGSGEGLHGVAAAAGAMFVAGLGPFLAVAVVAGLAGGVAQVGFTLAPKAAQPKLSNLSIKKGLERFKPATAGWELGRSVLKLGLLVAVVWGPVVSWLDELGGLRGLPSAGASTWGMIGTVLVRAAALATVIAAADYAITRARTQKQLRMTRQELRDELRHSEGDPQVRARRRRRQQELSRNRMIADVSRADVVVTNPTRLAVALRYGPGYPSPQVVAAGAGRLAARIRQEAYRHGVPVIEDRALARALFRRVRVGQYVPGALFEAVAVVLAAAYRRRGRRAA